MGVRKFRTVEEMSQERWRAPGDPELYRAVRRVWTFGARNRRPTRRPGVHRFRMIEDLDASRRTDPGP